ncbi:MAG: YraN family protein [Spirochaetes bacterium]|nr:YraN family protein [Spirochaetota bacterium]
MSTVSKGRSGESKAAGYLSQEGFRILEKNFKSTTGEVDIVAVRGGTIVFVEVKSWRQFRGHDLERALSRRKRQRIVRTSRAFLAQHRAFSDYSVRFDVLLVSPDGSPPQHIQGAFGDVWCE